MKKTALAIFTLSIAALVHAEVGRHALIIGIGNYSTASKSTVLAGVPKDMVNARRIATAMGVESSNITELRDDKATKKQILIELDRLQKNPNRVTVY